MRATALLEHFRAPRGADAEAKRLEEEFLASEAGKRTAEAIASGLRADLELRADGGFSMEFGTIPWDPKAPQTLQTVNLRGTWTHEGTKLMLTPRTRDGGPLATTGQEMTFLFADGRISTVPQGDPGPRFTLSRR